MTLAQGIERVLDRVGLSDTTEEFKDRARDYINQILAEVAPLVKWWWLNRTTTFNTVASTRAYQPVSGAVTEWYSFVNETQDRRLDIIGPDEFDALDPDLSRTGTVYDVFIAGQDTTTGYPVVELYYTPNAVETIRVRYCADIDEWTSANDTADMMALGVPRIMESVLIYGAASLLLEENGDDGGAAREGGNFSRALDAAKIQNVRMQGNRRWTAIPAGDINRGLITLGTDTVS